MTASSPRNTPTNARAARGPVAQHGAAAEAQPRQPSATDIARAVIGADTIALQISAGTRGSKQAQVMPAGILALAMHPAPPKTSEQALQIAVAAMTAGRADESSGISTATPGSGKNGKAVVIAAIILIAGLAAAGGILVGKSQAAASTTSTNR